jgi:YesN/AraC family two-component response regulator
MSKKDIEDNLDLLFESDDILHHNIHALKEAIKEIKLALANLRKKYKLIPITNGAGLSEKDFFEWFNIKDIHQWFKNKLIETIEDIKIIKSRHYSAKVLKAIEFIEKNYAKDIHIEDIANVIGISGAYLRLKFKEETKMTINEYITNIRVEKAIELLESGEYKVYEVAEMVGYGNSQYFSQVFKKISGKPPRSFINGNEEVR